VSDAASLKTSEQGPPPPLSLKGIREGHVMRKSVVATLLIAVVIVGSLIVYVSMRVESLETRVNKWNALLDSIKPGADHDSAIRKLCDFIEPSATQLLRAERYYQEHANPAEDQPRIVASSVDSVTLSESKDKAMVRYGVVLDWPNGERTSTVQNATWEKKNGKWYRVQIMPDFPKFKPPPFPEFKPPPAILPPFSRGVPTPAEAITDPPISEAQFQQIQEGMTWEQVVQILGRNRVLSSQSHSMIGGSPYNLDTYEWKWNGGKFSPSCVTVNFTNGYVDHTNYRN